MSFVSTQCIVLVSRYLLKESDLHFEREDSPDDDILELSSDGEEDKAILAASRRLAYDVRHLSSFISSLLTDLLQ